MTTQREGARASLLLEVVYRDDARFGFPLPYVMSLHQAPTCDGDRRSVSGQL